MNLAFGARLALLLMFVVAPLHVRAGAIALTNAQVVDIDRQATHRGFTVLIEGERISAIGRSGAVKVPAGAQVIDTKGKWIMPGMVDAHIHLFQSGGIYTRPDAIDLRAFRSYDTERTWLKENAGDLLSRYLAVGVTTVIDVGGPLANVSIRDRFNREASSPRILLTGPLISTYQPPVFQIEDPPIIQADTPEQARAMVRQQLPYKPDLIKIWYVAGQNRPAESTLPIIQATIEAAHSHGLKVAVHAPQLNTAKLALKAGADILVHSVDDVPVDREFITLLKKRSIPYIPTLVVMTRYGEVLSQQFTPSAHDLAVANPFALGTLGDLKHLPPKEGGIAQISPERQRAALERTRTRLQNLKTLADAGVLIATGSDAGNIGTSHGSSYLDELLEMQKAGLSNWEILRASTLNGAKALGHEQEFGSLAAGKQANLIVLDADPLVDLRNTQAIHRVVNRGVVFEPSTLLDTSPAALVQQQVNAYNSRNLEAFLDPYSDDVEIYNFPGQLRSSGKQRLRGAYGELFAKYPALHCQIVNRIVSGNTVIDHERVTVGEQGAVSTVIAIYTISDRKISRVEFVRE